jgi:hypothetical protein
MAATKHRDNQLFVAPVAFEADNTHSGAETFSGETTLENQLPSTTGPSSGGALDVSDVTEAVLTSDVIRVVRHAKITLTDLVVAIAEADDFGGSKILDLPDSNILILTAETDLSMVKDGVGIVAATDITVGIGSAIASNSTLSGLMIDVLTDALTDDVDPAIWQSHTNEQATPALAFLDDAAAGALFLNAAATLTTDGDLTVSGTIDLYYIDTGNETS